MSISATSQSFGSKSLELSFQLRHEIQGSFITQYGTLPYTTDLKFSGTSIGAELGYKVLLKKSWYLTPSIGYYKFAVDKIVNKSNPSFPFGTRNYRAIDYHPDSTPFGYSTQKYHYNNLLLGIALGKEFILHANYRFTGDMVFYYLLNYSQKYHVGQVEYFASTKNTLGYLVTGRIGINKDFSKFYIGANFLLPLYKQIKKDKILFDNPNEKFAKWFGGYGFSLKIGKYLK